ncbi:hypothetical protein DESPIG_02604 [Desulfovibrio piger ATCC 29098]|uniref:Uncharacterized protein n=1 Tax=Desulfovibrio piger ATCC 29098 TaxID=411464 RepID=B6WWY2_9BACT|nr:hypothetical protein DESPIG_02604 [Desulfovibrio piger ATCC 29098]
MCQSHTGSLGWLVSLYAAAGRRARGRPPHGMTPSVRISSFFCKRGARWRSLLPLLFPAFAPLGGKTPAQGIPYCRQGVFL